MVEARNKCRSESGLSLVPIPTLTILSRRRLAKLMAPKQIKQ
jgi:hypothetical protein